MNLYRLTPAFFAVALLVSISSPVSKAAAENHAPGIFLTVDSPAEPSLMLELPDLDAMDQTKISTVNEFVSGLAEYSGPLARDLVAKVGGTSESTILLTAINEYQITVPAADFFDYDVVLATRMNGKLLSRRDKGPIWLMYPITDHSELQDSAVNSKLIWQLVKLEVQ